MTQMPTDDPGGGGRLRFRIGRYQPRPTLSREDRQGLIDDMAALPHDLRTAVPYDEAAWAVDPTVTSALAETRQPCPHCAELSIPGAKICRFCHGSVRPPDASGVEGG